MGIGKVSCLVLENDGEGGMGEENCRWDCLARCQRDWAWLECSGRWRKRLIHLVKEGELSNRDKKRGNTNTWTHDGQAGQRKREREREGEKPGLIFRTVFVCKEHRGVGASGAQMLIADLQLHPRLRRCCGWSCRARCPRHLGNQEIKKFWFMAMAQPDRGSGIGRGP